MNRKFKTPLIFTLTCSALIGTISSWGDSYKGANNIELKGPGVNRINYGSNYWVSSNLREWLNSSQETVRYSGNPPSAEYVKNNPYDTEAGFLSHFTTEEQAMIAVTERGNLFGKNDTAASTNGKTGSVFYNSNATQSINFNYPGLFKDWDNLGQVVTNEKVFLLTMKELTEYVQNRGWDVQKNPTTFVQEKYGYNQESHLNYFTYHPVHDIGKDFLEIISEEFLALDATPYESQGVAPALHLKKDAMVNRIKKYNTSTHNWTSSNDTLTASQLDIGDIVTFGTFNNEPIQWRVINKTVDGFPLLFSENVIDIKPFDAKGDYSQRFSYIDLENIFPTADVSNTTFQIQNIQGSDDITPVRVQILNEDKLFTATNNQITLQLEFSDENGIDYILLPDGTKQIVNSKNYTLNHTFNKNGYHLFGLMDTKGNFRYYVIPVGNLILPPTVLTNTSTSEWTNKNVTTTIKASTDVGYFVESIIQNTRNLYSSESAWGNYNSYANKKIRISGKVEYVSDKNGFDASKFTFSSGLRYKTIEKNEDEYELSFKWPNIGTTNLNILKQRLLNGEGPLEFDTTLTIPSNFFGELYSANWVFVNTSDHGNFQVKWSDLKFELLNNNDFAVKSIKLPSGAIINQSSYTDTISKEGELTHTYTITTGSGETIKKSTITRIDKTKPNISVHQEESSNGDIVLTLSLSDSLSGLSSIELPDRTVSLNGDKDKTISYTVNQSGTYNFKVTDLAGNTTEQKITVTPLDLTTEAKPSENMIRLDWSNLNEHTYQVYQKKEDSTEFQSISMTDLSKSNQVFVLNIYPENLGESVNDWAIIDDYITFTTWDNETLTLPTSGALKKWMEEPNDIHPKGYGQGVIEVIPISINDFNQNPDFYLKNGDNSYKVDVIMFGSWDSYGQKDISNLALIATQSFLDSGRGVLLGHDVVHRSNFNKLSPYFNIETNKTNPAISGIVGDTQIHKLKNGLLTNYPWILSNSILTIPRTHNSHTITNKENIWLEFVNITDGFTTDNKIAEGHPELLYETNTHTNNFYLSTWQNTAVIQTGHSQGQATSDEQKILANTLFYLNQLSDANYLNDHSGQDVKAPEKPTTQSTKALSDGYVEITFDTLTDQGSTYEYYVKASHKNGNSSIVSNIETETITSGIAGVSYIIDTNPTTEPDNQLDSFSNNKIKVKPNSNQTTYLHIKTIDHAGNVSETEHIMISIPKINTAEQRDETIYLNWDIEIPSSSVFLNEDFESVKLDLTKDIIENISLGARNGYYYDSHGNIRPLNDPVRSSLKIINGVGINGSSGVFAHQTAPNNGWRYVYQSSLRPESNVSNRSHFEFADWKQLETGAPAIIRFKAKGDGITTVDIGGSTTGKSIPHESITYAENLTSTEFLNRLKNKTLIKINNPKGVTGTFELVTAIDNTYSYNFLFLRVEIIKQNNQWYLKGVSTPYDWKHHVRPGQTVTPNANRTVSNISIGDAVAIPQRLSGTNISENLSTSDWTSLSFNVKIPDHQDFINLGSYFLFDIDFETESSLYFDELQIAYAPKSRLYRNGQLILEDFTVEHTDQDVKDTTAPEKALVSVDYVDGKLQLTWQEVKDKGTIYTYEVSGVNENGQESLRSEPKDVEFITGIKEYRVYLNGTLIDTTTNPNYQFNDKLTPSDRVEIGVVDHAGNESKTEIEFLHLTTEAKPTENMIRLDWNALNEHTYQVYQKKEGSDEFQSISMTDLSKTKQVQVLNIYPVADHIPSETFTTWEGQSYTLPKSASLKRWMEEPNSEHPKGYGQGLIHVTPISIDEFNTNSENLLKQIDGSWKYDVLVIGTWDNNGNTQTKINNLLNSTAISNILDFTNSGKGLLVGHDVVNNSRDKQWHIDFVPLLKLEDATPAITGDDEVYVNKKGLLVTYPWDITETETLNIPMTHTSRFISKGDVWLKYVNPLNNYRVSDDDILIEDESGTNNHYLTTWQNTAMIQTGHSDGEATPDEQKILANTLFYLNQLSSSNYLDDYSGQDVKAPSVPTVQSSEELNNGYIELTFAPFEDQGSIYDYYVKATHKNGSSEGISNLATETITSGIKGVSYIVDQNQTTEPDNQIDTLSNNKIQIKPSTSDTVFLHIKTIDNAGNVSETQHIPITKPPVLRSEVIDNAYVRLDWATEILPENIIWKIGYELNEQDNIDLVYSTTNGLGTGGQYFDNTVFYSGNYSLYSPMTYPDKGNWDYDPNVVGGQSNHVRYLGDGVRFNNGEPISISYYLKSNRESIIRVVPQWQYEKKTSKYRATTTEAIVAGKTKVVKVSDVSEFKFDSSVSFDDTDSDYTYTYKVRSINAQTNEITLNTTVKKDVPAGTVIKKRNSHWALDETNKENPSTDGSWQLFNLNTTVNNSQYIKWNEYEVTLRSALISNDDIWLDDLTVGYATKVKLYRDGNVIYQGYDSELDDTNATDKTAPLALDPTRIKTTTSNLNGGNTEWMTTFSPATDEGSTYSYQISSVNKYGIESIKSNPVTETVTSGLKGYSYVIDTKPTTEPDNILDLDASATSINHTGNGTYYLHIKSIDKAGNVSETIHIELTSLELTAEAKPSENMIRLDWTNLNESIYQVYQKKEGSDEFQSISTTDFSDTKQIKVLNIYPTSYGVFNSYDVFQIPLDSTFTTWDGETLTLPQSAKLKRWMEEPNSEHPKGYGKGLIEVTPVEIEMFNQNPLSYLKNLDGTWKYDVVMIGTWDANGNNADITESGRDLLIKFLEDNRGVLFGHDTIRGLDSGFDLSPYLNSLHPYVNLTLNNIDFSELRWHRSTNVEVSKKGLLNSYPWDIGNIGTTLTIPESHTVDQLPGGDIWFKFKGKTSYDEYNYYLTTWNNTAMIQTGHSNGAATPDEQKILANTLFYLNQLSSNNWLDDYSGQDVKAPEKPSISKTNVLSTRDIEIVLNELIDHGSTYEYYVKAIHKTGSEQTSNTVSETITTGTNGVSYVIDTNPTTEPDSLVDPLINQTIQVTPNQTKPTYLHIKTIDHAGNESETLHYKLEIMNLTAQAKPTENAGKGLVRLDWTNKPEHTYQVYQKKEDNDEFVSISTTNLSAISQIKVLNVYPDHHKDLGTTTCTTWDGEQVSIPTEGSLKCWMEAPNDEHQKGYGMGIIEVTPVPIDDFNVNPYQYLKNSKNEWQYQVIMFGSSDSNGQNDLSEASYLATKDFLDSGHGVLFGHDTVTEWNHRVYFPKLASYINVKTYPFQNNADHASDWTLPWSGSNQVVLHKTGLLTSYPWDIGEPGSLFNIPYTHSNSQIAKGDVWLKFINTYSEGKNVPSDPNEYSDNGVGTNMFYLTTWKNAAMIQTGHKNGQATSDEQKILANTLFYLNQLSDTNYLDDYSGQDTKAPNKPLINNHTFTTNGQISLSFNMVSDNGSTYDYYVKAEHKDGAGFAFSNIASATVTTGIKGYSWVANNQPDTIPDDIVEQSNNSNIKIPTNNRGPYYLHIKAIDKAGNTSETHHYLLTDTDKPTLTLTQSPTTWTNQDVIITATAIDHGTVPSGIKEIILPDGNKVSGSTTATFTATQNGTYTFEAVDFMGNRQTASITISNIDKVKPTGSIIIDQGQDEFYEEETEIHINMSDILDGQEKLSGIAKVELFDVNGTYSNIMTNPTDYQQTLPWVLVPYELSDGSLKAQIGMILTDKAGNTTTVYSKEVTIIKVRVEEFHLTDVVNPSVYNKNNPFTRLTYPNIPSQELLSGGSFEFEAVYSYPPTANTSWTADYEAIIHYIRPDGGRSTETIELTLQPVDGIFTARHSIPFSISTGTEVYLELSVKAYNGTRKLMGQDSFPDPQGTLLKIGEVTGDIRSLIQFNEIY